MRQSVERGEGAGESRVVDQVDWRPDAFSTAHLRQWSKVHQGVHC